MKYQAPESLKEGKVVELSHYWTLGILLFEKENQGLHPFTTDKAHIMRRMIEHYPVHFPNLGTEKDESYKALIMELLNKNPDQRLGSEDGIQEVMAHQFFS